MTTWERNNKKYARLLQKAAFTPNPSESTTQILIVKSPRLGEFEIVWKLKYGVWFLISAPTGILNHFRDVLTDYAFISWAHHTQSSYKWKSNFSHKPDSPASGKSCSDTKGSYAPQGIAKETRTPPFPDSPYPRVPDFAARVIRHAPNSHLIEPDLFGQSPKTNAPNLKSSSPTRLPDQLVRLVAPPQVS